MLSHRAISRLGRHLLLCSLVIGLGMHAKPSDALQLPVCPGLQQGACTAACQTATCSALASFFKQTYNESRLGDDTLETASWATKSGWEVTETLSCQQILSARGSRPSYCSWYGITCCDPEAIADKQCSAIHSVVELKIQVNGVNGSVQDPKIVQDILQLYACGLTRLNLQGNDLSGALGSDWGLMTNLTVLDLSNNWINGTIPTALRSLKNLTVLSLGQNFLSGPLPPWLGQLKSLQALSLGASAGQNADGTEGLTGALPNSLADLKDLELLNVETNALTGTLPAGLCRDSKLSILKLRGNSFRGQLDQLLNCTKLSQLDISSNNFSGTLPDSSNGWNWSQLVALDASNNGFTGSIPNALYGLSVLGYLNLGNNRLSGRIQRAITLMQYLKELKLNNNQLTGPIDENLWYLPQLSLLDLSHNRLSGTISRAVGLAFGIEQMILDNNGLEGLLPAELGIPRNLGLVNVANNSALSCHGTLNNATATGPCSSDKLLPCFLTFSAAVPRTDGSNMMCPAVMRRPYDEAVQLCSGDGVTQLGDQAVNLADELPSQLRFELDPAYYGYKGCECLGGYRAVWENNATLLTCMLFNTKQTPPWVVPSVTVAAVAAVMLLVAAALLVWLRMTVQLRPRWQREKELNENRKKGIPSGGPATIVVTDVESYSNLMQTNAPLTTKALGIHNAILRKAVAAHAGHVVEQEGDSWSVAFHTPMDAVAFCLQVQLALQRTNWPSDMGARQHRHRSFLSGRGSSSVATAAATASELHVKGDVSNRGSGPSPSNSVTAVLGSGAPGQMSTGSWQHQVQAARSASGGSGDLTAAAAAAVAGQAPRAGRGNAVGSSGRLDYGPLLESEKEGPSTDAAAGGGSLDSLMVLGDQGSSRLPAVELSADSADALTETAAKRRNKWLGLSKSHIGASGIPRYLGHPNQEPSAAPQQQQESTSFSSLQGTPRSLLASDRATSDANPAVHRTHSTPSGSLQNLLQSVRSRLRGTGSNTSSSDIQGDSFSATAAAPAAAGAAPESPRSATKQPSLSKLQTADSLGGGSVGMSSPVPLRQQQSSSRFWSMIGIPAKDKAGQFGGHDNVIKGLRVRMGVATGWVPRGTNIGRCALFELAKAVSDMANGGQVLLEANTFNVVKNRLTELGTVDHRGYNDKLRATASRAVMRQQSSCLFAWIGCIRGFLGLPTDGNAYDADALLLDMGEYFLPSLGPVIPAAAGGEVPPVGPDISNPLSRISAALTAAVLPGSAASKDPATVGLRDSGPGLPAAAATIGEEIAVVDAGVAVAAAAVVASSAVPDIASQCLQLYSILPRALHERAKLWLNTLTFREGTQQIAKCYFDAPGTGVADLSSSSGVPSFTDFDRPPLPAVTMVFAAVEGGKNLVRKRPEVAKIVHNALGRIMEVLLLALPERDGRQDGYLCRQQEGCLKYMLAFREPARAVEWALLLQEVLLQVPWPQEVVAELSSSSPPAGAADGDGSSGTGGSHLAMKIGLAEGHPDSISPDHLGRPDYFGNSVNLAARMMDAAAQGGHVVASVELAERIYSTWRFEAELGLYEITGDQHQPQPPQQQQQQQQNHSSSQMSLSSPFASAPLDHAVSDQQQLQQAVGAHPSAVSSKSSASDFQLPRVGNQHETEQSAAPDTPRMAAPAAGTGAGNSTVTFASTTAAAGSVVGSQGSSEKQGGLKMSASRAQLVKELLNKNDMLLDGPTYPLRAVHISGVHIGTYSFKGCGALDMISFTTDFMPPPYFDPAGNKGGKGTLVMPGTGPVVGLQDCPGVLPDVLPSLQRAWSDAAQKAEAAQLQQQMQQERQLFQRISLGPSSRAYRRSMSSAAAFAATREPPDGFLRYKAANDLGGPLSGRQGSFRGAAAGSSSSWSSGVGSMVAAAGRLPLRLNSNKSTGNGPGRPSNGELDVEAVTASLTDAPLMQLQGSSSFSVGQRLTGINNGLVQWRLQQQRRAKANGGQQGGDTQGRDVELAGQEA